MNAETILKRRDRKTIPHLEQYAPVWMESEEIITENDAVLFNVIFEHPAYGWVTRRYLYDAFNDVLNYRGQHPYTEEQIIDVLARDAYIEAIQSNVPNSYGG